MERLQLLPKQIPKYRRADTHFVTAGDRPLDAAYDRFAYLVSFFADRAYDEAKIRQDCPFLVQDVLFNSLLYQADKDLAQIARILDEDPSPHEDLAKKTGAAIEQKLWDEDRGTYLDFDLVDGTPIPVYFGPNLAGPLYAGIPGQDRAKRLISTLEDDGFGLADEAVTPIPSYDLHGFGFSEERYWRGPVWINIDWFLMHGLETYGYQDHAERLRKTIIELCRDVGFHEYFDPRSGDGLGSILFSWSAALLLDVLAEEGAE